MVNGNMMYVDVIQGADHNGYSRGRIIESFAIPQEQNITQNTTWISDSTHPVLAQKVTIHPEASLNVKSEVQFARNGMIKVAPTGKLVLSDSSSLLTAHPGFVEKLDYVTKAEQGRGNHLSKQGFIKRRQFWRGIRLKNNLPVANEPLKQGYLEMKEGSAISRALIGVKLKEQLAKKAAKQQKNGLLKVKSATFDNNIRDIVKSSD